MWLIYCILWGPVILACLLPVLIVLTSDEEGN
jgi:hypothetical protein